MSETFMPISTRLVWVVRVAVEALHGRAIKVALICSSQPMRECIPAETLWTHWSHNKLHRIWMKAALDRKGHNFAVQKLELIMM